MPAPGPLFALYLCILFFPFLCYSLPAQNASTVSIPDRAFYRDCLEVIRAYPNDLPAATLLFTRDASSGVYKLPQARRHGTCTGKVKLAAAVKSERSSWRAIKHKLDELNNICYREGYAIARDHVGQSYNIELKLQKYSVGDDEQLSIAADGPEGASKI